MKRTAVVATLVLAPIFASVVKDARDDMKLAGADVQGRPLADNETLKARRLFGNALDYRLVRLHNAPDLGDDMRVIGNDIYLEAPRLHRPDLTADDVSIDDQKLLMHDLTHVLQNQHRSKWQQFVESLRMEPTHIINSLFGTGFGYGYDINSPKPFDRLNREQQAEMVGDYFKAAAVYDADGCAAPNPASAAVCAEVAAGVHQFEEKLKTSLPLPGARTLVPTTLNPGPRVQPGAKPGPDEPR